MAEVVTVAEAALAPLARLLLDLRRDGRQVEGVDLSLVPASLEAAYRVQAEVARHLPGGTSGWKVGMTNAAAMRARGMTEPVYARLFAATTFEGHGQVPAVSGRQMFEAEYVFELGRDLPQGDYGHEELIEAVRAVRPGIEICGSRFSSQAQLDLNLSLADNSFHLGLVVGAPLDDWQQRRLDEIVTLSGGDGSEARGSGREVLGDPLNSLQWLASVALPDGGLKAGDLVASGVAAKLDLTEPRGSARAAFGDGGTVTAELA